MHPTIFAWRIPQTEHPGGLQPMGSQRVEHNWSNLAQPRTAQLAQCGLICFLICSQTKPAWILRSLTSHVPFLEVTGGMLIIPQHVSLLPKQSLCLEHPGLSYPHAHKSGRESLNGFRDHVLPPLLSIHQSPLQAPLPPWRLCGHSVSQYRKTLGTLELPYSNHCMC